MRSTDIASAAMRAKVGKSELWALTIVIGTSWRAELAIVACVLGGNTVKLFD